jgi:hypothetical protein
MYSEQYIRYIQDENNTCSRHDIAELELNNNHSLNRISQNYIEMREWMGQPGQKLLTATEKVYMESCVGTYNLVFH